MGAGRGKALAPELPRVTRITPEFTWIFLSKNDFLATFLSCAGPFSHLWLGCGEHQAWSGSLHVLNSGQPV